MQTLLMGKTNLDVFAETLLSLAQQDRNILAVTTDSRGSGRLVKYGETLPDQIVEIGIAEQNMVGISAGLASTGKHVFAVAPACFLVARAVEQIKNDVVYSDQPVKLIGISAGVSYGSLGFTHHSTHDLATLLALYNLDIVVPVDNAETRAVIKAAVNYPRPLYIRFGKKAMPLLTPEDKPIEIGKANILARGSEVVFIGNGETVLPAWQARELLEAQGVSTGVISMHTLRPLDRAVLLEAAASAKVLITCEEHSVNGGLGSLCASILMQENIYTPMRIFGFPDEPIVTGNQTEIFNHYGISAQGLADTALSLLHSR